MYCWFFFFFFLTKSCTDLNYYRKDNTKDQLQPSLRKLTSNTRAGSALLFGDDLTVRIKSLNAASLMKPAKMISKQEVFGKNQKNLQRSWGSSAYEKKAQACQSNSFSGCYQTGQYQFQKQSRHQKYKASLLFIICHKKLNVLQLETFITTCLNGNL